jgi:hypothetical protein
MGEMATAQKHAEAAYAIQQKLVDEYPEDAIYLTGLASASQRVGTVRMEAGDAAAAESHYQVAVDITREIAETVPKDYRSQVRLANSYRLLAGARQAF